MKAANRSVAKASEETEEMNWLLEAFFIPANR